jgi:hypothetical protein
VIARKAGRAKLLSSARTGAGGRARLVVRAPARGRVKVVAEMQPTCTAPTVRVARRG